MVNMIIQKVEDANDLQLNFNCKYFLLNYGLGDTINQLLYIESNIKSNYCIICPERNFDLIQFVLKTFIKGSKYIKKILVYFNPIHGFCMNYNYVSPINLDVNFLPDGIHCVHTAPNYWSKYIKEKYIQNFKEHIKCIEEDIPPKVILFTERSDNYSMCDKFWQSIVDYFNEKNIKVFHNKPKNKNQIYTNTLNLNNVQNIDLDFYSLIEFVKNNNNILIGQRSGIFDMLKFINCKKIIFYPEGDDSLFECRFQNDIYANNCHDVRLPISKNEFYEIFSN